jgi:SAM-dependent methyltransferase
MLRNEHFFLKVWPAIATQVTGHRAGSEAEILPLLRRLGVRRGARVLDVPCGFGRHSILLAQRGYRVTGVDIGPHVLALAREEARSKRVAVDFRRGELRRLRFRGHFDLVLNLFTSFGYFGDRGDQRVLANFHRALRPRGWLVLHTINRDFIVRHYQPRDRTRLRGFRLEQRARLDWPTSTIRAEWIVRWTARKAPPLRGRTHLRVYSCHELKEMLERAGFRRVAAFGGFRGQPVSMDRRWLVLLGQR